jgi:hypothetical protein
VTAVLTATDVASTRRTRWWLGLALPPAVAAAGALVVLALGWRGGDLPAHWFRVALVRADGFEVWNNQWFGGHHTLGYGALFPVLGAAFGIWTVAVLSAVTSAALADALARGALGRPCLAASLWFAAGTVTNLAIGRLPFALGLTVGLGALLAAQRRRPLPTVVLTIATAAASPVVSAFLGIVFVAWAWVERGRERRRFVLLAGAAIAPVLVIAALYPQGGMFPFRWQALLLTLVVCAGILLVVPPAQRLVRATAVVYALAAVVVFVVPSPVGANITRLGMYAAAPVVLAVGTMRRSLLVAALVGLWCWQWTPAFDAIARSGDDASTERSYYVPLLRFLDGVGAEHGRTEVVPTARHWETAHVAAEFPIARGWERQLDIRFNELFYEPGLTAAAYHDWLLEEGVAFVALADAPLDDAGRQEADLLATDLPYLRLVWSNAHWQVWAVADSPGIVDGPAVVDEIAADSITLDVTGRGDVTLRVRDSAYWRTDPVSCVEATDDGWIVLRDAPVGPLTVFLDGADLVDAGDDPCSS